MANPAGDSDSSSWEDIKSNDEDRNGSISSREKERDISKTLGANGPDGESGGDDVLSSATTALNSGSTPMYAELPTDDSAQQNNQAPQQPNRRQEENNEPRQCRICFGGDEDDDPSLGRMISPCKCRGSMKYVHIGCLNEWRRTTQRSESFFECDQCHYKYQFSRTLWANVLRNEFVVTIITLLVFVITVIMAGFIAKGLIYFFFYDSEDILLAELNADVAATLQKQQQQQQQQQQQPSTEDYYSLDNLENIFFDLLLSPSQSLFTIDIPHMISGVFLVGLMGCFSLLYYVSLSPFQWGGRGGRGDSVSALVLVVLVIFGVGKMLYETYKVVKYWSRRSMEMVESRILDVDD